MLAPVESREASVNTLKEILRRDTQLAQKISEPERQEALAFLDRYGRYFSPESVSPAAQKALEQVISDLRKGPRDPRLVIDGFFDRVSHFARTRDELGASMDVVSKIGDERTVMASRDRNVGGTQFTQENVEMGPQTTLKTIRRIDPENGRKEIVDEIVLETEKGAARDNRVVYSLRIHTLLRQIKKELYDQPDLRLKICGQGGEELASAKETAVTLFARSFCNEPGWKSDSDEHKDTQMTPDSLEKLVKLFNSRRESFPSELLDYINKLDERQKAGTLNQLDWKELERILRVAQSVYNDSQIKRMQKMALDNLVNFFAQATNSTAIQKQGEANFDSDWKDLEYMDKALKELEAGNGESGGLFLFMKKVFKQTKMNHEDQKYLSDDQRLAMAQAFAYVAYAVKAQQRTAALVLSAKTQGRGKGEEIDAAVEEAQQWMKLAQIQMQIFNTEGLAIQLERLKLGKLQDNMGLDDEKMKAEALRLADIARYQYLPALQTANDEAKETLLKQTIASFYLTFQNAAKAYLYDDTVQERLKAMAAKVLQIKALYLAKEFDKVKLQYRGRGALAKLQALPEKSKAISPYDEFLRTLKPDVQSNKLGLEALAKKLNDLADQFQSVEGLRAQLNPLLDEFLRLAEKLGYAEMPDLKEVQKENQLLSIKHSKLFAALGRASADMQIFSQVNMISLYLRKLASSEVMTSESDNWWSHFVSFKWMDASINGTSLGGREGATALGMRINPLTAVAYQKLGDKKKLETVLEALRNGRYRGQDGVYNRIAALDPKAAQKALDDYEKTKPEEYAFQNQEFESYMTKDIADKELVAASGVMASLSNHMDRYILGYMATAGAFDLIFMTVATAGVGQLAGSITKWGQAMLTGANAMQKARAAQAAVQLSRVQRVAGFFNPMLSPTLRWGAEYSGKVLIAWGNNFTKTLEIKQVTTGRVLAKQLMTSGWNAFKFNVGQTAIMALASTGLGSVHYYFSGEGTQGKDYSTFFWQGIIGGASFGAKSGLVFMMSPFPASAMGNGSLGRMMLNFANSPGPISSITSGVAQLVPRWSQSAVVKEGLLGMAQNWALDKALWVKGSMNVLTRFGGFIDGAGKYFTVGEGLQDAAAVVHFKWQDMLDAQGGQKSGVTPTLQNIGDSQSFGIKLGQISWLAIPVNAMYSPSEVREQQASLNGYYNLRRNNERWKIETAANGDKIKYDQPWYHRSWGENFKGWLRIRKGEGETNTITVEGQMREMANMKRAKEFSDIELMALVTKSDPDKAGGRRRISDFISGDEAQAKAGRGVSAQRGDGAQLSLPFEEGGVVAAVEKPLDRDEVFVTHEALSAWKSVLSKRLGKNKELRHKIIEAPERMEIEAGGRRLVVSGEELQTLKTAAEREELARAPIGFINTIKAIIGQKPELHIYRSLARGRLWRTMTSRPLEIPEQMLVRGIQGDIEKEVARKSRTGDAGNVKLAREQVLELKNNSGGKDAEALGRLADKLAEPAPAAQIAESARGEIRRMIEKGEGAAPETLNSLDRSLQGELTAIDLMHFARKSMDRMIEQSRQSERKAFEISLRDLRQSIESGSYIQLVNEKLDRDVETYKNGRKDEAALKELNQSIDLLVEAWSKGVFGQIFKERVASQLSLGLPRLDGKSYTDGEKIWDIPEKYQFKDANKNVIREFRQGQLEIIKDIFLTIAGARVETGLDGKPIPSPAKKRIYALLETAGGKSLACTVLIDFLVAHARSRGKEGAIYVTDNGDLVVQFNEMYKAFFKGRKPNFEIMTYSDLMVRQAEAQASGSLTPFQTHEIIADEFDTVGLGVPLSLGRFNGNLSFPEIDPVQKALREAVNKAWEMHKEYGGESLSREEFAEMLKYSEENKVFGAKFRELVAETVKNAENALKNIRSGEIIREITEDYARAEGLTRDQIYARMLKEYRNALGSAFHVGVIEAKYGGMKGWVEKILEGAYESASDPHLGKTYEADPDPRRKALIHFNNDAALDSLDTFNRTSLELKHGKAVTLDFEHAAKTDISQMALAAHDADALMIAVSGTLPDGMRPFFTDRMRWEVLGKGSDPNKAWGLGHNVLWRGAGHKSVEAEFDHVADEVNKMKARAAGSGKKSVAFAWASSKERQQLMMERFAAKGIAADRISLLATPGSNYYEQERYMSEIRTAKNIAAIKRGDIDVIVLVGQGGLRGLEAPLQAYAGGEIPMYVTDSHTLADVSLIQLLGRTDTGRIPPGAKTSYHLLDEAQDMLSSKTFTREMSQKIRDAAAKQDEVKLKLFLNEIKAEQLPDQKAIMELLKQPKLIKAKEFYRDYLVLHKLRSAEIVGDEKLRQAADPNNEAAMKEVLGNEKVLTLFATEMRRLAEKKALSSSGIYEIKTQRPPRRSLRQMLGRSRQPRVQAVPTQQTTDPN